jgi:hypothetical protein
MSARVLKSELLVSLIRWNTGDLAREAALSVATIRRAELIENET